MKNLRLIPTAYQKRPIVKAGFALDKDVMALVKFQKNNESSLFGFPFWRAKLGLDGRYK